MKHSRSTLLLLNFHHFRNLLAASIIAMSAATISITPAHAACDGATCSGGGTGLKRTPESVTTLLDLAVFDLQFEDRIAPGRQAVSAGSKVTETAAFNLLMNRLEVWRSSSPGLVSLIERTLRRMPMKFKGGSVPRSDRYHLPEEFKGRFTGMQLSPVAHYTENGGAEVSVEAINDLGDLSQAALLLHEALRQIQIRFGDRTTEPKLQEITARIILTSPNGDQDSLENEPLFGTFVTTVLQNSRPYISKEAKKICGNLDSILQKKTQSDPTCAKTPRSFLKLMEEFRARHCSDPAQHRDFQWVENAWADCQSHLLEIAGSTTGSDELSDYFRIYNDLQLLYLKSLSGGLTGNTPEWDTVTRSIPVYRE